VLPCCFIFRVMTLLYFAHLDYLTASDLSCGIQDPDWPRCRSNHLQGQDIQLAVASLALISTSSAVIRETHHALLTTVVVARVDKSLLLCGQ
jgi:hypothetical protein